MRGSRRGSPCRRILPLAAAAVLSLSVGPAAADDPPRRPRVTAVEAGADEAGAGRDDPDAALDAAAWRGEFDHLATRAAAAGHDRLAEAIRDWDVPALADRQAVFAIPARIERPEWVDDGAAPLWDAFVALRRRRAAATFRRAVEAAGAHDRPKSREESNAELAGDARGLPRRGAEAITLLHHVLRDDPDHAAARAVGGWVKRDGEWVSPGVARRLERGDEFDPAFGWLPRGRLARYRAGERYESGRWVDAAEDDAAGRTLKRAWTVDSDNWRVRSTAPPADAAALAASLEEAFLLWRQAFGAFAWEPAELEKRFRGRGRTPQRDPFAAVLLDSRERYLEEVTRFEPNAVRSDAIYWMPTRTAWFAPPPEPPDDPGDAPAGPETRTVRHECAHQLFAEVRRGSPLAGERCGFWAIEAVALYLESAVATPFGWTLGGPDAGRVPAARERLLEDGFHVPLADLTAMGRREFQTDQRLPQLYSEISGLADFFMNGAAGRHREAFLEYLDRVYSGSVQPDTLARLCGRSYAELDEEYRDHLARGAAP
ncbi:MAG: hypothetical protein ACKO3G_15240 [Planctomycetaceae bacterium]